ncbi:MAG: histidine kinase, partial [Vallitaleaceae bacterium]|nr:histidine kinase [Vallitaleaceae bacterium]
FHPFISHKENGTGLGLPIVSSIIDKHRGVIAVESTVGVGTKFYVTLPLAPLG